jgi:hypothetical protein
MALADSLTPGYYLSLRWGFYLASCKFVQFVSNTPPDAKKDCYLSFISGI